MLLEIRAESPEPRKIRRAVEALEAGEVIAYPTDTVYGLGCDLTNKRAVERLYAIKGMEKSHQLAFICPDLSEISRYAIVENQAYRILRRCLPGPYRFILEATREVPAGPVEAEDRGSASRTTRSSAPSPASWGGP